MTTTLEQRAAELWWLILLRGIAALILGLLLLTAPGSTLATLVMFLGAYWFVDGIFSIVGIFTRESDLPWGLLLLKGILGILAGFVVLRHPLYSTIFVPTVAVIFVGIDGLMIGVVNLAQGFKGGGASAVIMGILHILFGIVLLSRPLLGVVMLPFTLGGLGLVGGIILIVNSFRLRKLA